MIILGLGTRQIVAWSREPRNGTLAPALRTTQQGSWLQWYQERPIAKRPLSQITWATISKPIRLEALRPPRRHGPRRARRSRR